MGWIRCVHCENLQHDFVARTYVLIAPIQYVWHQVSCSYETIPNTTKRTETLVWGPMGWIGCICCEKSRHDFVAQTFVWIEPVQYVLQQVSFSHETIPNAPKYNKTDRIISLGSNGVDLVSSLRKIPTWLRVTNFCINCTSSPHFALNLWNIPNAPKHYETHQNLNLGSNGMDWVSSLRKNDNVTSWHELLH